MPYKLTTSSSATQVYKVLLSRKVDDIAGFENCRFLVCIACAVTVEITGNVGADMGTPPLLNVRAKTVWQEIAL